MGFFTFIFLFSILNIYAVTIYPFSSINSEGLNSTLNVDYSLLGFDNLSINDTDIYFNNINHFCNYNLFNYDYNLSNQNISILNVARCYNFTNSLDGNILEPNYLMSYNNLLTYLTNKFFISTVTQSFVYDGKQLLWVPWYTNSTYCDQGHLQAVGIPLPTMENNEMVSDEFSELMLLIAVGSNQTRMEQAYNTLTYIKSSNGGTLPIWLVYRNQTGIYPVYDTNDTASDASVRFIQALYLASQNNNFNSSNRLNYLNLAINMTDDHLTYERGTSCKNSPVTGNQICNWVAAGKNTASNVNGTTSDGAYMYTGYYQDFIKAMLIAYKVTNNSTYLSEAQNYTDQYLIAVNETHDGNFKVAYYNFVWNMTDTPFIMNTTQTNNYYWKANTEAWDYDDSPRIYGLCDNLRLVDKLNLTNTIWINLKQYCKSWRDYESNSSTCMQYYRNGTCVPAKSIAGYFENGLGGLLETQLSYTNKLTSSLLDLKYQSENTFNCFGIYRPIRPIKLLSNSIGKDLKLLGLESNDESFMELCNPLNNFTYLNFTFKDEATNLAMNGVINTASFSYYPSGYPDSKKEYTFTSSANSSNYSICIKPSYFNYYINYNISYYANGYGIRTLNLNNYTLYANTTTQIPLSLSTTNNIITFQIINSFNQPIVSAYVKVIDYLDVNNTILTSGFSDSTGIIQFYLVNGTTYKIYFTKSGYDDYSTILTPTESFYTITLNGLGIPSITPSNNDYSGGDSSIPNSQGVTYRTYPSNTWLNNGTYYDFNLTIDSGVWTITNFGFNLTDQDGNLINETSDTADGGTLSLNQSTNNYTRIIMNFYYTINGNTTNLQRVWTIIDMSEDSYSIKNLVDDATSYISSGLYGITLRGLSFVVFFIIFISVGILGYKYGVTSSAAISGFVFALVWLFNITLNWIPIPAIAGVHAVTFLPTILVGLIFFGLLIREVSQ